MQPAARDIESERGGVRHVQTLDLARDVDAGNAVAGLLGELTQTFAFGAEHERKRRTQCDGA